jgi:predicted XRE-type DNA-binding protein
MSAAKRKATSKKIRVEFGSKNVFADLGLPNPQERLAKSMLAHSIASLIGSLGLTQTQAAKRLGIDQPKISALLNGRLRGFSTDRLMGFLNALGRDVIITIQPAGKLDRGEVWVMGVA